MNSETRSKSFFVYMVRCSDRSLYTGVTNNLDCRIARHNSGLGAKYTRSRRPVELVYEIELSSRSQAQKVEYAIKKLRRQEKEQLISGVIDLNRLGITVSKR